MLDPGEVKRKKLAEGHKRWNWQLCVSNRLDIMLKPIHCLLVTAVNKNIDAPVAFQMNLLVLTVTFFCPSAQSFSSCLSSQKDFCWELCLAMNEHSEIVPLKKNIGSELMFHGPDTYASHHQREFKLLFTANNR